MRRSRSMARRDGWAVLLIACIAFGGRTARAEDRVLVLAVTLNGRAADTLVEARQRDGTMLLNAADLHSLGLRVPDGMVHDGAVALGDLPGLRYRLDERQQALLLQAEDRALERQRLGAAPPLPPVSPPGTGAVFNYNLLGTGGEADTVSGLFDAHAFSPYGTLSGSVLAQAGAGQAGTALQGDPDRVTRLDTTLTETDAGGMRRTRFGDVITGGLAWTRPFRMGGAQIASDFTMRPDLVTYPLPDLAGRAGVPSTVDVLVDGVRELSAPVQPGPFDIRQPPVVTGAGDIALVVRDATGQESVQSLDFYASPSLLAPGLASYSLEGGLVRNGYGLVSDDYADPAVTGTLRYGITDWLTAETHAEAAGSVQMAGAGMVMDLFHLGTLQLGAAGSSSRRGGGGQITVGVEHVGRHFSISASTTRASAAFRDVPSASGDPVPRAVTRGSVGLPLGAFGSVQAAYAAIDGGLLPRFTPDTALPLVVGQARVLSATYTRPILNTVSFYTTAYQDFAARDAYGAILGVSFALGGRSSADVSGGITGGQPSLGLDAAQAAVAPGDWGWRADAQQQDHDGQQLLEASHVMNWGSVTAGMAHEDGSFAGRLGAQGSLVLADGQVFAANRVDDSFAVVDTGGLPDVPVLRENRPIGKTDAEGQLLIPDLRGWDANRLQIDPAGLPADVAASSLEQVVRPEDHSGITVRFPLRRASSALVRLVDEAGKPIPVGATARVLRTGAILPVGHDGDVFLGDVAAEEDLLIRSDRGRCRAHLHITPAPGDIPVLGPIPCRKGDS